MDGFRFCGNSYLVECQRIIKETYIMPAPDPTPESGRGPFADVRTWLFLSGTLLAVGIVVAIAAYTGQG